MRRSARATCATAGDARTDRFDSHHRRLSRQSSAVGIIDIDIMDIDIIIIVDIIIDIDIPSTIPFQVLPR
jgi:hypothetical protein